MLGINCCRNRFSDMFKSNLATEYDKYELPDFRKRLIDTYCNLVIVRQEIQPLLAIISLCAPIKILLEMELTYPPNQQKLFTETFHKELREMMLRLDIPFYLHYSEDNQNIFFKNKRLLKIIEYVNDNHINNIIKAAAIHCENVCDEEDGIGVFNYLPFELNEQENCIGVDMWLARMIIITKIGDSCENPRIKRIFEERLAGLMLTYMYYNEPATPILRPKNSYYNQKKLKKSRKLIKIDKTINHSNMLEKILIIGKSFGRIYSEVVTLFAADYLFTVWKDSRQEYRNHPDCEQLCLKILIDIYFRYLNFRQIPNQISLDKVIKLLEMMNNFSAAIVEKYIYRLGIVLSNYCNDDQAGYYTDLVTLFLIKLRTVPNFDFISNCGESLRLLLKRSKTEPQINRLITNFKDSYSLLFVTKKIEISNQISEISNLTKESPVTPEFLRLITIASKTKPILRKIDNFLYYQLAYCNRYNQKVTEDFVNSQFKSIDLRKLFQQANFEAILTSILKYVIINQSLGLNEIEDWLLDLRKKYKENRLSTLNYAKYILRLLNILSGLGANPREILNRVIIQDNQHSQNDYQAEIALIWGQLKTSLAINRALSFFANDIPQTLLLDKFIQTSSQEVQRLILRHILKSKHNFELWRWNQEAKKSTLKGILSNKHYLEFFISIEADLTYTLDQELLKKLIETYSINDTDTTISNRSIIDKIKEPGLLPSLKSVMAKYISMKGARRGINLYEWDNLLIQNGFSPTDHKTTTSLRTDLYCKNREWFQANQTESNQLAIKVREMYSASLNPKDILALLTHYYDLLPEDGMELEVFLKIDLVTANYLTDLTEINLSKNGHIHYATRLIKVERGISELYRQLCMGLRGNDSYHLKYKHWELKKKLQQEATFHPFELWGGALRKHYDKFSAEFKELNKGKNNLNNNPDLLYAMLNNIFQLLKPIHSIFHYIETNRPGYNKELLNEDHPLHREQIEMRHKPQYLKLYIEANSIQEDLDNYQSCVVRKSIIQFLIQNCYKLGFNIEEWAELIDIRDYATIEETNPPPPKQKEQGEEEFFLEKQKYLRYLKKQFIQKCKIQQIDNEELIIEV